jgi:hypothetical protein
LEVSGQLHAPAALPPGKSPRYPLYRYIVQNFNVRVYTAAMFLEMSKAYDMVWTIGFAYKPRAAGITDSISFYYHTLLIGNLGAKMEGQFFEWKPVHAGVSQGAFIASLLRNINVANISRRPGYKYHNLQTILQHLHQQKHKL